MSQEVCTGGFVAELDQPFLETILSLIKSNPSIDKASHALAFVINWLNDLAKWRFVNWWLIVLNVVNHAARAIDSSPKCSPETFLSRAVKPDHSVNTTRDQGFRRSRFLSRLNQELSIFALNLSLSWLKIVMDLVP